MVLGACSDEPDSDPPRTGRITLTSATAWQPVEAAADRWRTQPDDAVALSAPSTCAAAALVTESEILEINTGVCNWVTLRQPLLEEIRAGETVRLLFWHLYLTSSPPAQGAAELRIDGEPFWRIDVAIPHPETVYKPKWIAARRFAKGAIVELHVHNHGANSWRLLDLTTGD